MNLTGTEHLSSNDISLNQQQNLNKNSIYMSNGIKANVSSQLTLNQNGNVLMKHSPSSSSFSSATNSNMAATGASTSASTILFNSLDSALLSDGNGLQNNHVIHQHSNSNSNSTNATTNANHNSPSKRAKERENLRNIIAQWNANRLDLFEISEPNEDLEFYGVMRFYFQDAGQKVATKCMRISSTASTADVINNLIEKFRPDIRMLSVPEYALYEIHENGEERKLADPEFPLLVQLNWHKDDREGRFLLRRMDEKTYLPGFSTENNNIFNRKLSKREKKEKKKKEKKDKLAKMNSSSGKDGKTGGKDSLAEKLYTELPETSFTRSISNPEAVMRRRRQQKLEKKLQQFSQEGGPEAGGTLRIFGESINRDVPYKTILLSTRDTAAFAVKEILEKYGKDKEDSLQYCLVQVIVPYLNGDNNNKNNNTPTESNNNNQSNNNNNNNNNGIREYILNDDDCPLIIERSHNKLRGVLTFHIRKRPPDYQPRRNDQTIGTHASIASVPGNVTGIDPNPTASGNSLLPTSYETTFNADGKVETLNKPDPNMYSTGSLQRHQTMGSLTRFNTGAQIASNSQSSQPAGQPFGTIMRKGDNILPAILEVGEEVEDLFLTTIIKRIDPNQVQFKLCITYSLYMVTRYRASTYFKPEITPEMRAELLISFCIKYANMIQQIINENQNNQSGLAFWLANSSEILHFLKNDRHLSAFTFDSQDILSEAVHVAFNFLVKCQQNELQAALSTFATDIEEQNNAAIDSMTNNILKVLSNSMQLLRRFRVNAALTIQLFSQLFHFINMWLFNKVIGTAESNYCSRNYGIKLKQCLGHIELWAEKQGLELAALCHLSRIIQTALFLQGAKVTPDGDLKAFVANFYKLNSLQLRALCERYQPVSDEIMFTSEQIQNMVLIARTSTDELIIKDGRDIRLEEESDLQLPFLLPEDGYSCDIVRGIPIGLQEFVQTLVQTGVCTLTIQPTASGFWTIYFIDFQSEPTPGSYQEFDDKNMIRESASPLLLRNNGSISDKNSIASSNSTTAVHYLPGTNPVQATQTSQPIPGAAQKTLSMPGMHPKQSIMGANMMPVYGSPFGTVRLMQEPEIQVIKLQKINNGIGLSIVSARGTNQNQLGIYIKSVVKGGAADLDGRLEAGDQLLKVDGQSLIAIRQEKAADLMAQTGPVVTLEVAKQGALYHGLGNILAQQASSSIMAKNMNLRPRFMANSQEFGGMHRFNGQYGSMFSQYSPGVPPPARMPGYNSLPLSLNYNYRNSQLANVNTMPLNYNNAINMRPESQLSYSSQTNILANSSLVNNSRINISTASLPANPAAAQQQQQQQQHHQQQQQQQNNLPFVEERHYQNIQMYQLNPVNNNNINNSTNNGASVNQTNNLMTTSPAASAARSLMHGSHSSLPQHTHYSHHQRPASLADQTVSTPPNRPVSAIVTSREQEQIFNNIGHHQPFLMNNSIDPASNQTLDPQLRRDPRELLRQEAKMEEIREELRRRDDRLQQQNINAYHNAIARNNGANLPQSRLSTNSQASIAGYNGGPSINGFRPNGSLIPLRSNGPPQPAPKPMRGSMSLVYNGNNVHSANYRYGSNSTIGSNNYPASKSGVMSPSPWEREEKEKEIKQRIEETKRTREEEIKQLESLPYRNSINEERLRKLRLERDFQKRAEEDDDEDDDDILERAENQERRISMQQDIERFEKRRLEHQRPNNTIETGGQKDRKQLEENVKEDKMKKRQDDELKVMNKGILKSINVNDNSPPVPLPKSSPPLEPANQRLDRLLLLNTTTDKSAKKVSWNDNVTSTGTVTKENAPSNNNEDEDEEEEEEEGEEEGLQEDRFSLQDIDDVLGSHGPNGKDWLNNYVSGSTPGVIGAQEVYNDPRKRIEAERFKSNQNEAGNDKLPEKLSFQEKMKMFAKTTGNGDETPVSRSKISKAQREIEDR